MFRLLLAGVSASGIAILMVVLIQPVSAGEKIQFHAQHVNVATRFDTLMVGDEPGHFIAFFQASGVGKRSEGPPEPPYKIEVWGTGDYRSDGTGKEHGYAKFTFFDGSSYYEEFTSQVADGHDIGTAVYYKGTGRFEGMKGGSKFDCTLLGDRFICEVDGTLELP